MGHITCVRGAGSPVSVMIWYLREKINHFLYIALKNSGKTFLLLLPFHLFFHRLLLLWLSFPLTGYLLLMISEPFKYRSPWSVLILFLWSVIHQSVNHIIVGFFCHLCTASMTFCQFASSGFFFCVSPDCVCPVWACACISCCFCCACSACCCMKFWMFRLASSSKPL